MATDTYEVVNDQTGEVFEVQGDRAPTQDEVRQLVTSMSDFPGQEGLGGTIVDVATTMGTGIAGFGAELGGRLVGLGVGALPGGGTPTETAMEFGEAAREAIATEPTTEGGQKFMEGLGPKKTLKFASWEAENGTRRTLPLAKSTGFCLHSISA